MKLASNLFYLILLFLLLFLISLLLSCSHFTAVMHLQIVAILLVLKIRLSILLLAFIFCVWLDAKVDVEKFGNLFFRDALLAEESNEDLERDTNVTPTCIYVGEHVCKALILLAFAIAVICFKLSFLLQILDLL